MKKKMITKAVIPAAGLGTRFLPVTKTVPKEMIPILDIPTIELIVQEAANSGIKDILIIISKKKNDIFWFYKPDHVLENELVKKNKVEELKKIRNIAKGVNIHFQIQQEQHGLGHAIYCAKKFANNEPFAVLLGDDVILKKDHQKKEAIKQLIEVFEKTNSTVVGVQQVLPKDVKKYGIVEPKKFLDDKKTLCSLKSLIEKPNIEDAPSDLAITGRYIFSPEIFKCIEKTKPGAGGEIQITDAINLLSKSKAVYALQYEGNRYDIGSKQGLVIATIDFALKDPSINKDLVKYLEEKLKSEVNKQ